MPVPPAVARKHNSKLCGPRRNAVPGHLSPKLQLFSNFEYHLHNANPLKSIMKKIPEVTLLFWMMKICVTTLGETAGDQLAHTMQVGYAVSSPIIIGFFFATLTGQLAAKRYISVLY